MFLPQSMSSPMPHYTTMPVRPGFNTGFDFGRNIIPSTFNHGGRVNALREIADMLRTQGIGDDKILAHINLDEAKLLNRKQGYSGKNPITGLPQFGRKNLLRRVARIVAPLTNPKQAYKDLRKHAPTLGSIAGALMGGPVGATLGGGLGGAISSRKAGNGHINPMSNALRGLGHGAIIGGLGHLASGMGGMTPGFGGPVQGQGGSFGGIGDAISGLVGGGSAGGSGGGGLGGVLGSLGISPLQALLGAGTIYGMSKSKLKQPNAPHNIREQIPDFMRPQPQKERKKIKFAARKYVPLPDDWNPETDPEHLFYQPYEEEVPEGYSEGGFLDGDTDGQADKIPARLSDGEFVMPADVVAACGSGSSKAGAEQMYDFIKRVRAHRNKSGTKLPPKAKSLSGYGLKMARR